jgi:uncharacterized CHY-type Zn-finger protein
MKWNKDAKIDATCVQCKAPFVITGKQLIDKETVICPNCQAKYDTTQFLKQIEDTIKKHRFNKTIRIDFKL